MVFHKLATDILATTNRHSPKIKFVAGVISLGASLYTMHKATIKAEKIKAKKAEDLEAIEDAVKDRENGTLPEGYEYTDEDEKKDRRITNISYITDMAINYGIPVALAALAAGLFASAALDWKNFALGIGSAYGVVVKELSDRKEFYKKELGEETYDEIEKKFEKETIEKAEEAAKAYPGKEENVKQRVAPYMDIFDESNRFWDLWVHNPSALITTLQGVENELEEQLQREGHLEYNTMRVHAGFKPCKSGVVRGLIRDNPDGTINHVSLGLFGVNDKGSRWFRPEVSGKPFNVAFNLDTRPIIDRLPYEDF